MSPSAALESEVFRSYLLMLTCLLVAGAAVLAVLTWVFKKNLRSIWGEYRSSLILAPTFLGCVFLGRYATVVLLTLVAFLGFKEFARATGLYRDWWITGGVYLGIISVAVASLVTDPNTGHTGWYGLFMALPVFVVAFLLLIPIVRNQPTGQLQQLCLGIVGFVCIGWMFGHFQFLTTAADNPYGYLLYLAFAVPVNDIAAFIFDRLLGRHPFRSNISARKTWEGFLGALAVSMIMPWLLWFSFPLFGVPQRILTGVIVGIGGPLGDLAIGVIKRDLGIKEMGAVIPGHGGILNRVDSLVYVAPLFLHMADYALTLW